jgi:four helix bundle protein
MVLAVAIYKATGSWPKQETYGLTSQVRRAAASVPANIAEGYGRENLGSYLQFLRVAQGSLKELETHLLIAQQVGIADDDAMDRLLDQADKVGRILGGLIRKLSAG